MNRHSNWCRVRGENGKKIDITRARNFELFYQMYTYVNNLHEAVICNRNRHLYKIPFHSLLVQASKGRV